MEGIFKQIEKQEGHFMDCKSTLKLSREGLGLEGNINCMENEPSAVPMEEKGILAHTWPPLPLCNHM